MRKKTIGEVLRLARINQGLSLEELQRKTDIQLNLLEALESDDFDQLPSPFYTRSFLRKYAWAVELDENLVLDAYDSGSMITYEEVDRNHPPPLLLENSTEFQFFPVILLYSIPG